VSDAAASDNEGSVQASTPASIKETIDVEIALEQQRFVCQLLLDEISASRLVSCVCLLRFLFVLSCLTGHSSQAIFTKLHLQGRN